MTNTDGANETPTALIPKMGESVSNSAYYKQLVMTDAPGDSDEGKKLEEPLDPFGKNASFAERPTTGVLLTFEQQWIQEGLALGELRKSLCLAPGEVTKLAVVDWSRTTRSRETSERSETEAVRAEMHDATAAESIQRAVANEAKTGMSLSAGESTQTETSAGISFLFFGASTSVAHNTHRGYAASSSTGSRDVAAEAAKNIQRRTAQLAQSTRSARATQIRELSENEQQSTTTRVVANYNHAHALTMQYYEVLQTYRLQTEVVRADRCVFIPMKPFAFTREALKPENDKVIELLRRVLQDLGAVEVDEMVGNFQGKGSTLEDTIAACKKKRDDIQKSLEKVEAEDLPELQQKHDEAVAKADEAKLEWENAKDDTLQKIQSLVTPTVQAAMALQTAQAELTRAKTKRDALQAELAASEKELARKQNVLKEYDRMFGILEQHQLVLNQQMWMRIDAYTWHRQLTGKTYPDAPYQGQPLGGLVDPTPVGYFGNYVAFTWDFPSSSAGPKEFQGKFQNQSDKTTIVLPTEGVFAEAVLGQSNSAEKIDITRFWNWQDSPIPILPPSMAPVGTQSRARDVALPTPLTFAPAIVKLREAGVPDIISDEALLNALQTSLIGDNAALIAAAATAGVTASNNAATGAGRAGQQVVDARKNVQDFTVGLANSEVAKIATQAVTSGATGGLSAVGGLLNAASDNADGGEDAGSTAPGSEPDMARKTYEQKWNHYLEHSTRSVKEKESVEDVLVIFVSACSYFDNNLDKIKPMANNRLDSESQTLVDVVNRAGTSYDELMSLIEQFKTVDQDRYAKETNRRKKPAIKTENERNQKEDQRLLDNLGDVLFKMRDQITNAVMPA